ncbi:MAG: carboxypeptidase regulatory-like domain-containing protein [Bryobacteraceae bacterium]
MIRLSALIAFSTVGAFCQEINATVSGLVSDPAGSPVAGATVTVKNTATGVAQTIRTGAGGLYLVPFLAPGAYEIAVEAKGFQLHTEQNVRLETSQRRRVDVVLRIGELSQSVTVAADPLPLETASGSLGQTVDSRSVVQLPNLNRNPLNLVFVAPNIAPNNFDRQSTTAAATMSSINGARPDDNETIIDGGSTISPSSNIAVLNPNVDAVAEVRIEANSYSAEFGRVMGGVVNVVTKSGTNALHGAAFEFHRNAAVSARTFFDGQKPRFTRNQFGGAAGGPVWIPRLYDGRNKTFWFVSFESIRQVQGLTNLGTVPTAAMREGDFSGLPALFDPATTAGTVRQPFAGNRIPTSRFDSVARNIVSYYPLPNAPGVNNFVLALPTTTEQDRASLRGDHNFGDRNRLFVRYMWDNAMNSTTNTAPRTLPDARVDPSLPQQPYPKQAIIGDTHAFSPRTVNEFRASFFRFYSTQFPGSIGLGFPAQLGLKGVDPLLFPRVDTTGILPIGHASVNNTRQNLFSWTDTLSHNRSAHSLRFGFGLMRFQFNNGSKGAQSGQFSFNQLSTAQPGQANSGHPVASLLLGLPVSSSIETLRPIFGYRYTNFAWFAQDDWRVNSRLTLNFGLRHEIETPLVEVNDLQSTFDVGRKAFVFAGRNGQPRALSDADYSNFGPRAGFAWTPFAGARTVIRGGYGIAYASTSSSQVQQQRSTGFTAVASFPSPDNGLTFPIVLRNGFPAISVDPTSVTRQQNINVNVTERRAPRAQMQQWNLNAQRQWRDYLVQLAYSGSKGTHLVAANYSLNQVPAARLGPGNAQSLRPYPDFQEIIVNNPNEGNSIYNAVSLSVNRRFARGLTLVSSFTFQKVIDSTSGRGAFIEYGSLRPQDNFNRAAERSVSQFDRTRRFVAAWVYELPFKAPGPARLFVSGWELSGLVELMDGTPLAMSATPNRSNSLGGGSRPNRAAGQNPRLDNWTPQRAFNTAAYVAPEAFTFGNVSRTEPTLRAPGWATVDASLLKTFDLYEGVRLQFRVEAYNLQNRVNFQRPNTALGTPQFGQILLAWPSRAVQGGLKLIW